MQGAGDGYGLAAMDFEYVPVTPGSRWVGGESAARRRQRRLSSPSLRTYLTPAFDAVAAVEGGVPGYSSSSSSSGGLDLGFDASLLRYRRAVFSGTADLDNRLLFYSPQSAPPPPPPPPQVRMAFPVAEEGLWVAGGGRYGSKLEAGRLHAAPDFQVTEDCLPFIPPLQAGAGHPAAARGAPIRLPAALRSPGGVVLASKAQPELWTPKSEGELPSGHPELKKEEDRIAEVLYGQSGRRRLPVFREICPE